MCGNLVNIRGHQRRRAMAPPSAYDYGTGQPSLSADLRGQYIIYGYNSSGYGLDRIKQVNYPNGGYTTYSYPTANETIVQQDQSSANDGLLPDLDLDGRLRASQ